MRYPSKIPFYSSVLDFDRHADDLGMSPEILYIAACHAKDEKELKKLIKLMVLHDVLIAKAFLLTHDDVLYIGGYPFYRRDYIYLARELADDEQ